MVASLADDDYQKALFVKLLSEGTSAAPVQSWTQGAARLAQALVGGYGLKKAKEEGSENWDKLSSVLLGGVSPQSTAGASSQVAEALNPKPAPRPVVDESETYKNPQDHINRTWGGLTPEGRDISTRTVLGEAANQGDKGMAGVADVMRNRAVSGGYGGQTMDRVAQAKGQFEPWMTEQGRQRMASYKPQGQPYQDAQAAVDGAAIGSRPDITGGATNFYSPGEQKKLSAVDGRAVTPSWAAGREPSAVIGGHNFYPPQTRTAQAGPPQAQAAPQSNIPPQVRQQLEQLQALGRAGNRDAKAAFYQLLQQHTKPNDYDFKVAGDQLYRTDSRTGQASPIASASKPIALGGEQRLVDPSTGREIVGASQNKPLPVEVQQKLNLAQTGMAAIKESRKVLEGDWDTSKNAKWAAHQAGVGMASGEVGRALGDIQFAVENAMHIATGAAAPNQEVARKARLFTPTPADDADSRKRKMDRLEMFLGNAQRLAQEGRTVPPSQIDNLIPPDVPSQKQGGGGDLLNEAREAIRKGAPRDAVMKRLQERGVQVPAGF
jgi:hypothetical protein